MPSQHGAAVVSANRVSRDALYSAGKFLPPRLSERYLPRPRLDARLDDAADAHTIVVSGPAGAGKSALAAAFLARRTETCSWITLDEGDNDPARFWMHLSYAFDRLFAGGRGAPSANDDPAQHFLRSTRELDAEATSPSYLVLDAAQVLLPEVERVVLPQVADALPRSVRLVLVTRREPALPLHRLRVQAELLEISGRDLRFSLAEAVALFGNTAGRATVAAHLEQTQGWAAGLVLARDGLPPGELERAVRAYLYQEVVEPLPGDLRRFLMEIACLRRLDAAVCERVTGRADAAELLRLLEREHAFVTSDPDGWGRYDMQPQLRRMLQDELRANDPVRADAALADAARWYEEHAEPATALEQWLDAGREHDALRCLRRANDTATRTSRTRLRDWTARIDPAAARGQSALLLDLAIACAIVGDDAAARDATDRADNLLLTAPDPMSEFRSTLMHARLALGAGDVESQVVALQAGRGLLRTEPALGQASLQEMPLARQLHPWLALGQTWLERAADGRATLETRPNASTERTPDRALVWGVAASIALAEGHLDEATRQASRAREAADAADLDGLCTWPAALVLASLAREQSGVDAAERAFVALIGDTEEPEGNVISAAAHVGLAMVLRARGDASGALAQLSRIPCETLQPHSVVRSWIDQAVALTYLRIGEVRAAREALGPPPHRPSETLVAALIALSDRRPDEATRLSATVHRDAPRPRLLATLVDARAAVLRDDADTAIANARLAMHIALEHGFLRSVLDYGTALLPEFAAACVTAADAEFVSNLRDELALSAVSHDRRHTRDASGLSGRELDVLRYLATHLTTREIAQALHVSRNTVKSHMQHLYRKLGVGSRSAAVERARVLQFLR